MQAVAADLKHHGQRFMTEPIAALTGSRRLASRARGVGGPWLMFRHDRMILCSEQVLDYEAKTGVLLTRGAADDQHYGRQR